jgi:hypothetical protein
VPFTLATEASKQRLEHRSGTTDEIRASIASPELVAVDRLLGCSELLGKSHLREHGDFPPVGESVFRCRRSQ